jgi:hypothetical protein
MDCHRCSLPLIYVPCQIELGKLFIYLIVGRTVASSSVLQEQLAEGSASYVLDEDLCPSTEDREMVTTAPRGPISKRMDQLN